MKNHEVRELRALVIDLCKDLEGRPWAIARLEKLLLGCIDLTRRDKAWQATSIAIETTSQLTSLLSKAKTENVGLKTDQQPWWVSPRVDLNYRPVATTEQMQAAADAAMKNDIGWFVCTGCGKKTATADGKGPLGWFFNVEVDGEVYKALCQTCFGVGIPADHTEQP